MGGLLLVLLLQEVQEARSRERIGQVEAAILVGEAMYHE
jgi:hypothetical protein